MAMVKFKITQETIVYEGVHMHSYVLYKMLGFN